MTGRLLAHYDIAVPLLSYHEHNAAKVRPKILDRLAAGQAVALVTDAGTPAVSDPGYKLVRAAIDAGHRVEAVPGPTAPVTALVVSGLPTDRFLFAGFPPPKAAARRRSLGELATVPATLILFEAPARLAASLADMAATLGDREAAVARELTKLYEEVRRDRLGALAAHYAAAGPPKGEVVVVVGPPETAGAAAEEADDAAVDRALAEARRTMSLRDAVDAVAATTGRPKKQVYARALALDRGGDGAGGQ
jgi:16S rRNA (cytidine1402-2'-O)-methyltransferase